MCTENGTCRIFQVAFRIVGSLLDDLFLVFARCIALECAEKFSRSMCICNDFFLVIAHLGNGCCSLEHCGCSVRFRGFETSLHLLDICHRPSDHLGRHFKTEFIVWLQKDIFCLSKPLTDSTVSCLSEITALRMLRMCAPCQKGDLHIRKR